MVVDVHRVLVDLGERRRELCINRLTQRANDLLECRMKVGTQVNSFCSEFVEVHERLRRDIDRRDEHVCFVLVSSLSALHAVVCIRH